MKKIIYLLFVILLLTACGTSGGNDEEETSQGNQGTGEPIEEDTDMSEDQTSGNDTDQIIDQLEFNVAIEEEADLLRFKMELTNNSGSAVDLSFSSGQKYEITIQDPDTKQEVYRYSDGQMFTEAIENKTIEPNESLTWEQAWDYTQNGEKVEAKDYQATVQLIPMSINREEIDKSPFVEELTVEVANSDEQADKDN
ncbi:BsuPI-related putative proteinase inhibitor [Aquisalibacillus elongatus]|uniref:Intracellular proteinase inhibitor BsuPI n=1 Tax=Aquisalibacillus elongatus TaxID=485577 RepID=A0A3N5C239_9BACI|nr:BsuPI-related putative proteinase inhibitor [Aquisalibacillus elongatus]RPF52075.1 intracellular proteinase inhibitor BsuPI [Aquisalibacillus elongatus]